MTREEREAAVDWFATRMKLKLREPRNEAKGGWRDDHFLDLFVRLEEECNELYDSIDMNARYDAIISEACDVAAFAMFIADKARMLKEGT